MHVTCSILLAMTPLLVRNPQLEVIELEYVGGIVEGVNMGEGRN